MSIPSADTLLLIEPTISQVVGCGLPIERHGKAVETRLELVVQVPLKQMAIDKLLDPQNKLRIPPTDLIFTADDELQMPDVDMKAPLRKDMHGLLSLKGLGDPMEFPDASIVGEANRLTFATGRNGILSIRFRFDASKNLRKCIELVHRGEATVGFIEVADPEAPPAVPENQGELPV